MGGPGAAGAGARRAGPATRTKTDQMGPGARRRRRRGNSCLVLNLEKQLCETPISHFACDTNKLKALLQLLGSLSAAACKAGLRCGLRPSCGRAGSVPSTAIDTGDSAARPNIMDGLLAYAAVPEELQDCDGCDSLRVIATRLLHLIEWVH